MSRTPVKSVTSLVASDPVIAKLEVARTALASATSIHTVKKIVDVSAAAEVYAKRQHLGKESEDYCFKIKIEALGRLGELLKSMPKATGTRGQLTGREVVKGRKGGKHVLALPDSKGQNPTLADYNLDYKTSAVAQQLADLPQKTREAIGAHETTLTEERRKVQHKERPKIKLPEGKYRVIYADPPWQYNDQRTGLGTSEGKVDRASTAASQHYPTMSVDELSKLKIEDLAGKSAVLFCWATFPLLPDALKVIEVWGFEYKTAFVWHKSRGSFGHYHKADAELLLVATRGSCTPDDSDTRHSQIITGMTKGHSRKPDEARKLIDTMYSHGPRIELFARQPANDKWKVWGNEV